LFEWWGGGWSLIAVFTIIGTWYSKEDDSCSCAVLVQSYRRRTPAIEMRHGIMTFMTFSSQSPAA
jgi:hypothetical protein